MATDGKQVRKNYEKLKRAVGLKGDVKPGDVTMKAREIMSPPKKSSIKLPPADTKRGLGVRGLV